MRPVDKGKSPYDKISHYNDAKPYLRKRIGDYCSYCEFPILHVPEVEHKESKSTGGDLLEWKNLLLSCKYCNTRKGTVIKAGDYDKWLWPDEHNTFLAFRYDNGIPSVNEKFLETLDDDALSKAENVFCELKLGNIPKVPYDDCRYMKRMEVYNMAQDDLEVWKRHRNDDNEDWLNQMLEKAKLAGFFSVWMNVFKDEETVRKKLIEVFLGTDKNSFNQNAEPVLRNGDRI